MPTIIPIPLPQFGPNDINATLAEWLKPSGHWVHKGEVIGTAETTKSVFDLESPDAGVFLPLLATGSVVATGAIIAVLTDNQTTQDAVQAWLSEQRTLDAPIPATQGSNIGAPGVRTWTLKAELLAQRHQIDLTLVPSSNERGTEADVQTYLAARTVARLAASPAEGPQNQVTPETADIQDLVDDRYPVQRSQRLLIIGGGNGAVQIIDALAKVSTQHAVGIFDDNATIHGKTIAGVPVWGAIDFERAQDMAAAGEFDAAVISISTSIPVRTRIFEEWKSRGIAFANVIHPSCIIGINTSWGRQCHHGPLPPGGLRHAGQQQLSQRLLQH